MILEGFIQFFFSFVATVAFAIICNVSKKALLYCGFCGALGWMVYWIPHEYGMNVPLATLLGSIVKAFISTWLSRKCKMPVTVFNIPGLVPLVPGALAYQSVRALAQGDYVKFMQISVDTLMVAGAIALGLILTEVFNANISHFKQKYARMSD